MAQNKNSRKSEGLCQKIRDAVGPLKSRIRRISHQPQGSISVTSDKKQPSQTSPQTKPVHVLHQPSLSKMIPVGFEHFAAQENSALATLTPVVQSAGKENSSGEPVQKFGHGEILIVRGEKELATPEKFQKVAPNGDKPPSHVHFAKAMSKKDDDSIHEGKFSDYISKVKNRMMKTASNVGGGGGGGGGGRISPRRDSFNDKVTNYINHAKIKIRTTTNVGVEKNLSLK